MSEQIQATAPALKTAPPAPAEETSNFPRLIWAAVALVALLMFAGAFGVYVWSHSGDPARDLKKARSVSINYTLKGNRTKTVTVSDPAELRDLLDTLEVTGDDPDSRYFVGTGGRVDFLLPNGQPMPTTFLNQTTLERAYGGAVYLTPRFYEKVNEIASKNEGRPIDVLKTDN